MNRRPLCRLQIEELEPRAVPALFSGGHLVGCPSVAETVTAQLTGGATASGNIPSGLLRGKVALSNVMMNQSGLTDTFAATLTIKTKLGNVTIQASGSVGLPAGSLNGTGTVTGGTRAFQGVTGTLALGGTVDLATGSLHGTLTGMVCGSAMHHGHGHHHH
jgi:hypothetical protein